RHRTAARFWHPLVMWNEHSFLFEVFWCVLLYFTVTAIELAPNIMERFHHGGLIRLIHRISFGVVVVGISLSSLHHSSLGSLFLVTPQRLHPLWYSSLLPLFFILSAMGAGLMVVVMLRILYARWYDPEPVFGSIENQACRISGAETGEEAASAAPASTGKERPMLKSLAAIAASILGVYLILKLGDLLWNGTWRNLIAGTWESYLYAFELLISTVIPITLLLLPRTRNTIFGLGMAAGSAVAGLALNRLDVGIFGYFRDAETTYFPTLAEWAIGIGVIAAAGLVFLFIVENFGIFDNHWKARRTAQGLFRTSYGTLLKIWNTVLVDNLHRVTLIAVFTIPVAWALMYPPYIEAGTEKGTVQPSEGRDALREVLRIDGNRSGVYTDFPHADHQRRLGGEGSCGTCHHLSFPGDRSTPCFRCHKDIVNKTLIFDHFLHMQQVSATEEPVGWFPSNFSCNHCHEENQPKTGASAKPCLDCHKEDMGLKGKTGDEKEMDLLWALSYQDAMHSACISCHQEKQDEKKQLMLGDCAACHPSLKPQSASLLLK
ncbi:MAG: cytochrome c3 family protein, partial [Planctomycetota bacterium]